MVHVSLVTTELHGNSHDSDDLTWTLELARSAHSLKLDDYVSVKLPDLVTTRKTRDQNKHQMLDLILIEAFLPALL